MRWSVAEKVLGSLPAWNGRIVVDGTNPVEFLDPNSSDVNDPSNPLAAYGIKAVDLGGKDSSEVFRQYVPGARVVKAFNHLDVNVLPEPEVSGGKRVLFYSGDDAAAKSEVRTIIEATGLLPGGPWHSECRRPARILALRFAGRTQLYQDLTNRILSRRKTRQRRPPQILIPIGNVR